MKPLLLGIAASFFFAFTFVLNRAMDLSGGSWAWSASLRYFFMIPLLLVLVYFWGGVKPVVAEIKAQPQKWLLWSTVGFGLFYAPLCFASAYGPGWLIAGTWQITILSGSLLAPLFYKEGKTRGGIPFKQLGFSFIILIGVVLMQLEHATELSAATAFLCTIPILIASFAYPLGNRKMMEVSSLNTFQRVLGMTLSSLPFWIILSVYAYVTDGLPKTTQMYQSSLVALLSGVCATVLFFAATDLVKKDSHKLGAVEATQSMEVLFALLGEVFLLSSPLPSFLSWVGMGVIVAGMVLHSYQTSHKKAIPQKELTY
ncbi:multidrug resistance efflux transporter family protein [Priestia aryabhattai]|uniref:DMT family transporter n=1 Tax=Priestia TaxID=2800373 RepID=UPI0008DD469B|nr:multidrug resistance efflux transporter family protein [Priestia aryabhattai]MBX9968233.1 multidrug resistance efflux transporter family protein [Priestia aryabhattai]MBZ6486147.1 multidrug resistance efflux transporter family protein [Priestia aryabhattai]MDH3113133.1 multidrug resistance efflux transporter family protein [Priestia aryabhattai]MDH3127962.1 multidrug resistance efflux transporter family protein [Priestia aryabhattai]MDH3131803.1 multidrug resistance efflux transporter famil